VTAEIGIDRLDVRTTRFGWGGLGVIALATAGWSLGQHGFDLSDPGAVAGLVASAGLLLAPRWPILAAALALADFALNWPAAALFFASIIFATRVRRRAELAVAGLFVVALAVALLFPAPREPGAWSALVASTEAVLIPGMLGLVIRASVTRMQLRRERDNERLRVLLLDQENAEMSTRLQIAHELHDGLGHRLSLIVLGLSGVDGLLGKDDEKARVLLQDVQTLGHEAMTELRDTVLGSAPASAAHRADARDGVATIVDRARRAGVDITLRADGSVDLDEAGRELVERVVTEGVTNVAKHAPGAQTVVRLGSLPAGGALVEVVNSRPGGHPPDVPTSGTGLSALRADVAGAGGTLEAGPVPAGGYRLALTVPGTMTGDRA
jgi:signal transduction histidine kinase